MDEVFKFLVLALLSALPTIFLRKESPAFAFLLSLAAGFAVLSLATAFLAPIYTFLMSAAGAANILPESAEPIFKALLVAILTKICSAVLEDAGEKALGACVDMAGAAAALYVSLPLLSAALDLFRSFL